MQYKPLWIKVFAKCMNVDVTAKNNKNCNVRLN